MRTAMREQLGTELDPLDDDPLDLPSDQRSWEPWPPTLAQANAQSMAVHDIPRTTKLTDRTGDEIMLDEVERISI